ncbi:MAG: DUF669 domain-containing protein [Armatimonadetes bacterium]|nr:DUF669 domain-containing protein [Armatimonadota bacterium]
MSDKDNTPVTAADLADFDEAYEQAEAEDDGFETVPDGKYQVTVDRVELTRTSSNGDPMLKWTLRILGPTHEGRLLWRYNVMASNEKIAWIKKDLLRCGVHLPRLSELPANLERLLDINLEVTKKTRGDFESVFIDRRIRTAEEASSDAPAKPAGKPAGKPRGKAREALSKF